MSTDVNPSSDFMSAFQVHQLIDQHREILGIPDWLKIPARFSTRRTSRAGVARFWGRRFILEKDYPGMDSRPPAEILLSTRIFRHMSTEDRRDTVLHELCHIATFTEIFLKYGFDGAAKVMRRVSIFGAHGLLWKQNMRKVGLQPKPHHSVNVVAKGLVKTHSYTCQCPGKVYSVSTVKHNRIRRGLKVYKCRQCGVIVRHFDPTMQMAACAAEKGSESCS